MGLSEDFEPSFKNIVDMNKSSVYGGSKRNICSVALLSNLCKLQKRLSRDAFAAVLNNEVECKRRLLKLMESRCWNARFPTRNLKILLDGTKSQKI